MESMKLWLSSFENYVPVSDKARQRAKDWAVETCPVCASQRVLISVSHMEGEPDVWTVSCGGCGCCHNVSAVSREAAIAAWNKEAMQDGTHDYALRVDMYQF